jgi:fructose-bisphosphate aldolase, class I
LSDCGKAIRLRRILGKPDSRALVVAFDHALVIGPIPGTEDARGQVNRFILNDIDALLMNLGILRQCAPSFPAGKLPGLIARIDWTSMWTELAAGGTGQLHSCLLARPEEALHTGADAVLIYMTVGTGDKDFETKEIKRTADAARECERIGIPLIVETLARGKEVKNPTEPKWLNLHTRMAAELGADVIKTEYSGDTVSMSAVVAQCPIPILVLGGSRDASDDKSLDLVQGAVEAGAAGVFFGRNVFQATDMEGFLRKARQVLDRREAPVARR